jgi:hypothetical protein
MVFALIIWVPSLARTLFRTVRMDLNEDKIKLKYFKVFFAKYEYTKIEFILLTNAYFEV